MRKSKTNAERIQGIENLLSKGRYPFTREDEVRLKSCLSKLKQKQYTIADVLGLIRAVIKWLCLLLEACNQFKDLI